MNHRCDHKIKQSDFDQIWLKCEDNQNEIRPQIREKYDSDSNSENNGINLH